jgi:hypothetical protein
MGPIYPQNVLTQISFSCDSSVLYLYPVDIVKFEATWTFLRPNCSPCVCEVHIDFEMYVKSTLTLKFIWHISILANCSSDI